jgi:hypothetical protein
MAPQIAPKKRPTESAQASLLTIYDGQTCLGSIRVGVRGDAVAYSVDGKRIGSFPSEQAALAAFNKASAD